MSLKNFFSLERRVYSEFRKQSAKACEIKAEEINKIRLLFLFDKNKAEVFIYSSKGNFKIVKELREFDFAETVKEKAEEVIKNLYEVNVIEAARDFTTEKSENKVFYTDLEKNKLQTNFSIF